MHRLLLVNFVLSTILVSMSWGTEPGVIPSVVCVLHVFSGLYVYFKHGEGRFTLFGIFALMSVFFLGFPYLYFVLGISATFGRINEATMLAGYAFSSIAFVYSQLERKVSTVALVNGGIYYAYFVKRNSPRLVAMIIAVIFVGVLMPKDSGMLSQISEALIFGGVALASLMFIGAVKLRTASAILVAVVLLAVSVVTYFAVVFSGFGRIRLVSLGLVFALFASTAFSTKWLKLIPLLLAPILLAWAGAIRSNKEVSLSVIETGSGLGSLLAPLDSLGRLIAMDKLTEIDLLYGQSYLYFIYYWIPRSIWPEKPYGLGKVYVEVFDRSLVEKGHSFAGSYLGEVLMNFGEIGVFVAPFVLGWLFFVGVRWFVSRFSSGRISIWNFIRLALIYCVLAATISDFVWADTNTLIQRAGTRILILFIAFKIFAVGQKSHILGRRVTVGVASKAVR